MRSRALQISILAILALAVVLLAIMTFGGYTGVSDMFAQIFKSRDTIPPETVFQQYTAYIADGRYEDMYAMLDEQSQIGIAKDDFVARNKKHIRRRRRLQHRVHRESSARMIPCWNTACGWIPPQGRSRLPIPYLLCLKRKKASGVSSGATACCFPACAHG